MYGDFIDPVTGLPISYANNPGYGVMAPGNEPVDANGNPLYPGDPNMVAGGGILKPGSGLDAGGQVTPTTSGGSLGSLAKQPIQPSVDQQEMNQRPAKQGTALPDAKVHSKWLTNAPDALAHADREQRSQKDWGSVGNSIGTLVRIAASMGAGGAAGGAMGGGAGAGAAGAGDASAAASSGAATTAPGSVAGASSGQTGGSFLSNIMGKYTGGGGGDAAASGDTSGMSDLTQYAKAGKQGMDITNGILDWYSQNYGSGAKKKSAMAELGLLPEYSPQLEGGEFWSTRG